MSRQKKKILFFSLQTAKFFIASNQMNLLTFYYLRGHYVCPNWNFGQLLTDTTEKIMLQLFFFYGLEIILINGLLMKKIA